MDSTRRIAHTRHLLALSLLASPALARAQSDAAPTPTVAAAPAPVVPAPLPPPRLNALQLDLGAAVIGGAYERVFGEHFALQFEAHFFGTWFFPFFGLPAFTGAGVQVRPTFFFLQRAPAGLYVAPFVRTEYVRAQDASGVSAGGAGFSAGAWVGYSAVIARVFNLRLGAGAQYMYYRVDTPTARVVASTVFPALDLILGWLF